MLINEQLMNTYLQLMMCIYTEKVHVAGTKYSREGLLKSPKVAIRKAFLEKVAFVK